MLHDVDPFIGTAATDLPAPRGLAATWWWPKPQTGNTHPGAASPLGMVSACAYSGAYPTGYGRVQEEHLERDGYILFLSRVARAKGIYDLIIAYGQMQCRPDVKLVVAGTGPALEHVRAMAMEDDRIVFLTDVDDNEKPLLMRGCAAYVLPTRPEPDFVETFGIALTEKMLAGGGPIITTITGGTGEAVGDAAVLVEPGDIAGLAEAVDHAVLRMSAAECADLELRARAQALQFDRVAVFDSLLGGAPALPDQRSPGLTSPVS